ncbi:hypothetical protein [Thermonema sp.]|uniref:hypothetical protein n=1 Tax=Thermonema sp. TaxID=2231181 RepID=UPI00258FF6F8|nr:hypothetical protein [Thermonema sp.]
MPSLLLSCCSTLRAQYGRCLRHQLMQRGGLCYDPAGRTCLPAARLQASLMGYEPLEVACKQAAFAFGSALAPSCLCTLEEVVIRDAAGSNAGAIRWCMT